MLLDTIALWLSAIVFVVLLIASGGHVRANQLARRRFGRLSTDRIKDVCDFGLFLALAVLALFVLTAAVL